MLRGVPLSMTALRSFRGSIQRHTKLKRRRPHYLLHVLGARPHPYKMDTRVRHRKSRFERALISRARREGNRDRRLIRNLNLAVHLIEAGIAIGWVVEFRCQRDLAL